MCDFPFPFHWLGQMITFLDSWMPSHHQFTGIENRSFFKSKQRQKQQQQHCLHNSGNPLRNCLPQINNQEDQNQEVQESQNTNAYPLISTMIKHAIKQHHHAYFTGLNQQSRRRNKQTLEATPKKLPKSNKLLEKQNKKRLHLGEHKRLWRNQSNEE